MSKNLIAILVLTMIAIATFTGSAGYFIGKNDAEVSYARSGDQSAVTSIFTTRTASINGRITRSDNGQLTVNSINKTAVFDANKNLFVTKPSADNKPSLPLSGLEHVELNKFALINLQMVDGKYKIVSIVYPAAPPKQNSNTQ